MIPERIGRYRLLELVGRGAIGDVYRALDPDLDRDVAIKIISGPITLDSEDIRHRFRREVQLAAHLHHPHIITVYDVGLDQDPPYLVSIAI
jgi:serine/threonine-protein kinase